MKNIDAYSFLFHKSQQCLGKSFNNRKNSFPNGVALAQMKSSHSLFLVHLLDKVSDKIFIQEM